MKAIEIKALEKRYGQVKALDGLDLTVESGSVFGFLGPNGAGKTTTLRILTGLAKASGGQASIAGVPVSDHQAVSTPDRLPAGGTGLLPLDDTT